MTAPHSTATAKEPLPGGQRKQPGGNLSGEDKVVICFSLIGFLGSILLYLAGLPPIMISIFLSAGLTSLVYRFLGGIQGASFAMGALKLTGTIGALVGIAFAINYALVAQMGFRLISDKAMVGEWRWDVVSPSESWDGMLTFSKDHGNLKFHGEEYKVEKVGDQTRRTPLLEMTDGKATLVDRGSLILESNVQDDVYGRNFHWRSVAPFSLTPAFRGELRPEKPDDPNLESQPWGMLIYKIEK